MSTGEARHHQVLLSAGTSVLLVIGIGSYILRLWSRRMSGVQLWYDDYCIGLGLTVGCIPPACTLIGMYYGLGKHVTDISASDLEAYLKIIFAIEVTWAIAMATIKTAILLLYWRLFPNKHLRWTIYAVEAFVLASSSALLFGMIFQCLPIYAVWKIQLRHRCIDQRSFYVASAAINMVSDVIILAVPMPVVWGLKLSVSRKITLSLVLLVGGFVCIISSIRLAITVTDTTDDVTWSNVIPALWCSAEIQMAVVGANLALMRPLFARLSANINSMRAAHEGGGKCYQVPRLNLFRFKDKHNGYEHIVENQRRCGVGVRSKGRPAVDNYFREARFPLDSITVRTDLNLTWENV